MRGCGKIDGSSIIIRRFWPNLSMNYLRQKSLPEFSNHGEATTAKSDLEQRIIISSRLRQRYGAAGSPLEGERKGNILVDGQRPSLQISAIRYPRFAIRNHTRYFLPARV